jgi:hypothetical protein
MKNIPEDVFCRVWTFFFSFEIYLFNSFIHMCICCLSSSPLASDPLSPPHTPPHFQAETVLPLSLILLKRQHKHNKKDKAFLLLELRIAIQRDSWSSSRVDLCHFKVSVLIPVEWEYQMLSCFGFSTYSHTSRVCSPLSCDPSPTTLHLP